ncbi:glycosyl transferase family 2 [Phocaeicola sp. KGMB11183]|uniref:Glycosyl transferase family 2 n=1 Tax=Phocaeicola acetigenes TaxID=3016083 RepID=A0ABT4PJJ8_9BACT|nr:glycosyl transferase family 2 [Phocaeicola sp. KGMB11183]MCZ8373208.1 glycosyl transferase family 2 [Phocaeicola sp. KGMB11183]
MENKVINYTAVIRTLGTAGNKFQALLESLERQTLQPAKILVYIAEGYAMPKETIGKEQYIYVKKGMVAQRALPYDEIDTEYILFLDDDVYLPATAVAQLYQYLVDNDADVISPDVFPNSERSLLGKWLMKLSGRMVDRPDDGKWGYKVMRNSGYSYNANPKSGVYLSQTNAGPCFFCKKEDFLRIHFEEELWMDQMKYALGDDQVMYYKMYCMGLKQLTWFHSGIKHLDAGSTMMNEEKERMLIYSDFRFKTIFWHRFIYLPDKCGWSKVWSIIAIGYTFLFTFLISLLKGRIDVFRLKFRAIKDAVNFIKSEDYRALPLIKKVVR